MAVDPARAKALFLEASDLASPEERAAYLDRECGGDAELRARVEVLLAAHDGDGTIREPDITGGSEHELAATQQMTGLSVLRGPAPSEDVTGRLRPDGPVGTITEPAPAVSRAGFTPGQVIAGRYTLRELLGEGGMGTVYRAEQSQPVKRQVALKLIRTGMDSRAVLVRFDAERQALALMDHPSIARVYDGGVTEANQPFFVMELVRGVPITDYCDQHRLPVRARLELFVAVCQAVQHAHQKGIIHRDIKPSNVMVTEVDGRPTPKVIDFGVAKATEFSLTDQSFSDTGAIVGTPAYMSPEQADPSTQDIDTRTDVYALGVILYELLAGAPPLDAAQLKRGALLEMLRIVREVDPPKPSTKVSTSEALPDIAANRGTDPVQLRRALRGDLDWIVMKALEKDRTRRYETANGLGTDILHHLASEPVLAAPPSRSYRLRKFVRKHRVGVIAASLVLLVLLAGVTGTTWGLFEARRSAEAERLAKLEAQQKKALAEENARKALAAADGERLAKQKALAAAEEEKKAKETVEAVLGFVENHVFAAARPKDLAGGMGYDVKLADAVQAALPSIEKEFHDKPLTEARLRMTIGGRFLGLGKPEIAVKQFEAARALYRRELGPDHPDTLRSMGGVAGSYVLLDRHTEALMLMEETLALMKAKLGPDHPETLEHMNHLAQGYAELGRPADAVKLQEETLALMKAKLGPDHPDTLLSMHNLGGSYLARGRSAEALKLQEETLALMKAKLGPDHPNTLLSMNDLAGTYYALGQRAEAVKLLEETLALSKAKLGPDDPETLDSMHKLAISYLYLGRHTEALKVCEETLALCKAKLGPDHPRTLRSMNSLANSYAALGRRADGVKLLEETLALCKAKLGPDHLSTLDSMHNLAAIYHALGRHAEALELFKETLALRKAKLGLDHSDTLNSMHCLADTYQALGRQAEALEFFEEPLALMKAKLGPDHPDRLARMRFLAGTYHALGRRAEAVKLFEETLALMKAKLGPDHPDTLRCTLALASGYFELGRRAEAVKLFEETLALMKAELGPDHPDTLKTMRVLACSYVVLGRRAEAVKLFEETLALRKAKLGPDHPDTVESMIDLGVNYHALGRRADAVKIDEETLALSKVKLGADHPDTLRSMHDLAFNYVLLGRHADAAKLNEETLALRKAKLGPDHPDTLENMNALAFNYRALGRPADAVKLNEEMVALRKAKLGPDDPDTLRSMNSLAANYRALGRRAEALKLNEEALALSKTKLGPDHPQTLESMQNLAATYHALGRSADAVKLNEEALALRKAKLGPDHAETLQSMQNLANSYLAGGRTREALPLLARCSAANSTDTLLSLAVAALQAWFGQDQELAVTREGILAFARGTDNAMTARRAVRACGIRPARNKAELDALLALGGTAVKVDAAMDWNLQALGIAEYRSGNAAAAATSLLAAAEAKKSVLQAHQVGISAFYRAMCLFELGKREEARALASTAAAKMKPLPADEQNPLAGIGSADDLILWLAYKEAKAMIHFEAAPTAEAPGDGK